MAKGFSVMVLMATACVFGVSLAFPALTIQSIKAKLLLSEIEVTTFNSITSLFAIAGPFVFKPVMQKKGRRMSVRLIGIVSFLSYLLLQVSTSETKMLAFIHRATIGIVMGGISAVVPVYLVEIAKDDEKDFYGTLNQIGVSTGVVLGNVMGGILTVESFCFVCVIVSFLIFVFSLFIPESPVFVALTRTEEVSNDGQSKKSLFSGEFRAEIIKGVAFMFFQQFSGVNALLTNAGDVLNGSAIAATMAASSQLVACLICSSVILRLGCEKTWNFSCIGAFCSLMLFAISNAFDLGTLPKGVAIFGFQLSFGFGLGPIPWIKTPLLFPDDVRGASSSLIAAVNWISSFLVVSIFPILKSLLGLTMTFVCFAVIMLFAVYFSKSLNQETIAVDANEEFVAEPEEHLEQCEQVENDELQNSI